MRRPILAAVLALAAGGQGAIAAAPAQPPTGIAWPDFLRRLDLVWTAPPASWENSPFIGNGILGATIHVQGGALSWEISRSDVTSGQSRYPMGRLELPFAGVAGGGDARLDLWNAEASGDLRTAKGEIHWRSFAAHSPSVIVIELSGTRGENQLDLVWVPTLAKPPRARKSDEPYAPNELNPPPNISTGVGTVTSTQSFVGGGAFAVVLRRAPTSGPFRRYVLAVGRGNTEDAALADAAGVAAQATDGIGLDGVTAAHLRWWHGYYPESFLSVPDPRLEAFYWIQMYKLGSAMRPDGPILDLLGPWYRATPKNHIWWNQDVEQEYQPLFEANRLFLAESLFSNLDRHRQQLIANVPRAFRATAAGIGRASDQSLASPVDMASTTDDSEREVGDLAWVSFLYWEYYRYQMDDAILRNRVLPILERAMGYYLDYARKGPDGRYHLPPTLSPETGIESDANYDLALFRWGLQTLISSCERLRIRDARLPHWQEVVAGLPAYPADASGLLIGRGRPVRESQKHYSHLLAIYPLHLITPSRPEDRALIVRSLRTWASKPGHFQASTYTGMASMDAYLGDGEDALRNLHTVLDRFVTPNTFNSESGPAIDAPISAATSLQEMLLQSWGGAIEVFPAVPDVWQDASFESLRTEGAFLVSAVRRYGRTAWVRIQSLAGSPCHVVVADWPAASVHSASAYAKTVVSGQAGRFNVLLPKGGWVVLAPAGSDRLPPLEPVEEPAGSENPYPAHYRPGHEIPARPADPEAD